MSETWQLVAVIGEGDSCKIRGVNVWGREWKNLDRSITVYHPHYPEQKHRMSVYELATDAAPIIFAAGEFSSGCWGFYTLAN